MPQRTLKKLFFDFIDRRQRRVQLNLILLMNLPLRWCLFNRERRGFCSRSQFEYLLQLNFNIFLVFLFNWSFIFALRFTEFFYKASYPFERFDMELIFLRFLLSFRFPLLPECQLSMLSVTVDTSTLWFNSMPKFNFTKFLKRFSAIFRACFFFFKV